MVRITLHNQGKGTYTTLIKSGEMDRLRTIAEKKKLSINKIKHVDKDLRLITLKGFV